MAGRCGPRGRLRRSARSTSTSRWTSNAEKGRSHGSLQSTPRERCRCWSRLLPPVGAPERTECFRWISFILTELETPLWTIAKHRFALPKERRVPAVIDSATWEFGVAVHVLEAGVNRRPFLAGDTLTVADILAGHTLSWAKSARFELAPDLERYLASLWDRNAGKRARDRTNLRPRLSMAQAGGDTEGGAGVGEEGKVARGRDALAWRYLDL